MRHTFRREVSTHLAAADDGAPVLLRDLLGVTKVINRCVRDDDEVHRVEFIGLHRISGKIVEEWINEDAPAVGVDKFVRGNAEVSEAQA